MNGQSIPQIKLISLFLRKFFRSNYQFLWSKQDQAAFTVFTFHFTADECLPFIINKKNEHPYFFKPDKITKRTIDFISFDPRSITKNNLIDDNRPYCYEQNIQEQQSLFTTSENYNENDNNNEDYTLENQNVKMAQSVVSPPQYIPIQQDIIINTSASVPEPMNPFDGLDHSHTPEEYLHQVEARLLFAIGEELQNNPVKYRSWHNRRMAYIHCSLIGTALD